MAENQDGQEKTEDPTPKRLREAREKGQVPRSRELSTMLVTLAGAGGLLLFGSSIHERLLGILQQQFSPRAPQLADPGYMLRALQSTFVESML
ncbi:MAG: EscU/YscU/HrcU family type III secretion system export apparatus switch protein, partial [Pseudomonadota bacterium]